MIEQIDHYSKQLSVNLTAILSTFGLSVMQMLHFLDGILPTVSLLLTTVTLVVLLYLHLRNAKRVNLEIKKLQKELDAS